MSNPVRRYVVTAVFVLSLAGCRTAVRGGLSAAIHLQDVAGYPVLVPGSPSQLHDASQTAVVKLGVVAASQAGTCSVSGKVFALAPPAVRDREDWTVTSPSPQGWQTPPPEVDLRTEWLGLMHALSGLQAAGCFQKAMTAARAQQIIAETIPIPADEALVFRYGFTGSGVVDLLPGMMLQVERSLLVDRGGKRELQSMEADYDVIAVNGGVGLHRARAESLHQPRTSEEIFHLERLTGSAPMLRLFLQNADAGAKVQRPSVLLAASHAAALDTATDTVDRAGCSTTATAAVKCITFHEAVSLLIACRVNGKQRYLPLGTALTWLLDNQGGPLATLTIQRLRAEGTYASLIFPRTQEAAMHIILQNGDVIAWR